MPEVGLGLEEQLIGALLLAPEDIPEYVVPKVKETYFYNPRNAVIFREIQERWPRRTSLVELVEALRGKGKLEAAGGQEYILHLLSNVVCLSPEDILKQLEARGAQISAQNLMLAIERASRQHATSPVDLARAVQMQCAEFLVSLNGCTARHKTGMQLYDEFLDARAAVEFSEDGLGYPSGVVALDRFAGGLFPASLNVIAGLPGWGKTLVMLAMMRRQILDYNMKVGFISLEMEPEDVAVRHLMAEAKVGFKELYREGRKKIAVQVAEKKLSAAGENALFAFELVNAEDVYLTVWEWKLKYDVQVIYVDHLQQVETKKHFNSYWERIAYVADLMKRAARDTKVALVVASQFTRFASTSPDKISEGQYGIVKGGTRIEEVADRVMYLSGTGNGNHGVDVVSGKIVIVKNRRGKCGSVPIAVDFEHQDVIQQ